MGRIYETRFHVGDIVDEVLFLLTMTLLFN